MLTWLVREKASGGRGSFQIGLRAAATLTRAEVTAEEPPGIYFNPGSPFSSKAAFRVLHCHHHP